MIDLTYILIFIIKVKYFISILTVYLLLPPPDTQVFIMFCGLKWLPQTLDLLFITYPKAFSHFLWESFGTLNLLLDIPLKFSTQHLFKKGIIQAGFKQFPSK